MSIKSKALLLFSAAFIVAGAFFLMPASAQQSTDWYRKVVQTSPFDLHLAEVGVVEKIIKSDTIQLSNNKIYKIDNIRIPLQIEPEAHAFVTNSLLGKKVGIYIVGKDPSARADRVGHILAHIVNEDGHWIQSQIVSRGLAWVTGTVDSRDLILPLYKFEDLARAQGLGLWQFPEFAVKNNTTIHHNTNNSFQIYEGKLEAIRYKDDFVFFNFDKNPQTDFTISFRRSTSKPFKLRSGSNSFTPNELVGSIIRVRGWIVENGGPMIELEYQEQLEFPGHSISPIIYH